MKLSKIFNLNDPGWGRGNSEHPSDKQEPPKNTEEGPPDLDQVFNDFSKKFKNVFGGGGGNNRGNQPLGGKPKRQRPSPRIAKFGIFIIIIVIVGLWLASGFFIVKEGQVGIVTKFGKYNRTVAPGFQWHIPNPIENVELVDISKVRSFPVGYRDNARNKVLPEALMLTEDENIVDVQFDVQYRLKTGMKGEGNRQSAAADYLFQTVAPDESVRQAAETAMREIVGKQSMNKILYESRTQAAADVRQLMQHILDRYRTGIEVITVAIQNVQPPEQVQAAFEDAIKAGQDNERQKNEGLAYASKVIPEARGQASRIVQDAEGYKAAVLGDAKGAAQRFLSIEKEYDKSPKITEERMYISTLEKIYANSSKVLIDASSSNNMLYLPIDKLIEQNNNYPASSSTGNTNYNTTSSVPPRPINHDVKHSELDSGRSRDSFTRQRPSVQ